MWAANCPEWIFLQFGAGLAGLTLVTVNPACQSGELEFVLRQSRAQGIVLQRELRGRDLRAVVRGISDRVPELRWVKPIDEVDRLAAADDAAGTELPLVRPEDPVQIQYTSGTTGFPKGAHLAHQGMTFNALAYAEAIGVTETDTWVNPLPLFHTTGCGLATLGILQTGGCQVLAHVFDTGLMFDLIATCQATVTLGVPTMFIRMLDDLPAGSAAVDSLRIVTTGGAPVPVDVVHRIEKGFGVTVAIGFGQTESSHRDPSRRERPSKRPLSDRERGAREGRRTPPGEVRGTAAPTSPSSKGTRAWTVRSTPPITRPIGGRCARSWSARWSPTRTAGTTRA